MNPPVKLQPLVRARVDSLGDLGAAWRDDLPGLVAELADRWALTPGRSLPGGSASYVLRVRRSDGSPAVLKIGLPDGDEPDHLEQGHLAGQARTLRAAAGAGYARLHAVDLGRRALLMEELGPTLQSVTADPGTQLRLLASTLQRAWLPADVFGSVRSAQSPSGAGARKAAGLTELITERWDRLGGPCPRPVVDQALRYADSLHDPDPDDLVWVHGDPHPMNALQVLRARPGAETGYCLIDPDGFVEDRAYDLGVTTRDFSARVLAAEQPVALVRGWCELLSGRTGVDADRIWRWSYLERVSTGLYVLGFGAERVGRPFLDAAARLLD